MSSTFFSDNPKKRQRQKVILWSIGGGTLFVIFIFTFGFVVQFLWNITMADIFGLPSISYWQAIGLFILAKIFFGFGIGGSNSSGSKSKKKKKTSSDDVSDVADQDSDFAGDETFQKFWQEEGREAYEAFQREGPQESK